MVLRHRVLTLLVMAATIALTVMLYVKTPKGYFPQDDTGLIFGGTRASPEISFEAMAEAAAAGGLDRARRPGGRRCRLLGRRLGLERLGQRGRMFISLKPLAERGGLTAQR